MNYTIRATKARDFAIRGGGVVCSGSGRGLDKKTGVGVAGLGEEHVLTESSGGVRGKDSLGTGVGGRDEGTGVSAAGVMAGMGSAGTGGRASVAQRGSAASTGGQASVAQGGSAASTAGHASVAPGGSAASTGGHASVGERGSGAGMSAGASSTSSLFTPDA